MRIVSNISQCFTGLSFRCRKSIVMLFFLCLSFPAPALPVDTTWITSRIRECLDSIEDNPAYSKALAFTLQKQSESIRYQYGILMAVSALGNANRNLGYADSALALHQQALALCRKEHFGKEGALLDNIGYDYMQMGNYQQAQENFQSALKIYQQTKDSFLAANTMGRMSQVYAILKYNDKAIYYAKQAALFYEALNRPFQKGSALSNLATVFLEQDKYDSAKMYLLQALTAYKQGGGNEEQAGDIYTNMGICYEYTGKADSATLYYLKGLRASQSAGDENMLQAAYYHVGNIYNQAGDYKKAEPYFKKSLELGVKYGNMEVIYGTADDLSKMYAKMGNYKDAYTYGLQAREANDSIFNRQKIEALTEQNVRFETQQLELRNNELEKKVTAQRYSMLRNWFLFYGGLSVAAIVLLGAWFYIRKKKYQYRIQNIELEQKQYRAQMNPHFIFNCMNSIQHYIVHNDVKAANKFLSEFATLMRRTLDINANHFITVQDEMSYLKNYLLLEQMRFDEKFTYRLTCDDDIDKKELTLPTMMLQPFAENAIQHGLRYLPDNSGVLTISFHKQEDVLVCMVDDNGIGRRASNMLKNRPGTAHVSQGVSLIGNRLGILNNLYKTNATLDVVDKIDAHGRPAGTTVTLKFPVTWK